MSATNLLPCPFCGEAMPPHDDTSWVRCLGCGAETGWQADGEGAITAWNTRATTPDPRDEVTAALVTDAAILEIWGLSQQYDDFDPVFRAKIRAIIAAAKAVMK